MSVETAVEQLTKRPDYRMLWHVANESDDLQRIRATYKAFVSGYLEEKGLNIEPAVLEIMTLLFGAISWGTIHESEEETVAEAGAPPAAVAVLKGIQDQVSLADPERDFAAFYPLVAEYLSSQGYAVDAKTLEALCVVGVALLQP